MTSYSFGKDKRLLTKSEFKRVFDSGEKFHRSNMILIWKKSLGSQSRLGLVVSKKVGNAVIRGRVKRKLREAFRLLSPDLLGEASAIDLVVIAKRNSRDSDYEEFYNNLQKMLKVMARKVEVT